MDKRQSDLFLKKTIIYIFTFFSYDYSSGAKEELMESNL